MKVIVYPQNNGAIAMVFPTGELSIEETAKKDVPTGKPYLIIDRANLPDGWEEFFEALEADFSNPDGYGD